MIDQNCTDYNDTAEWALESAVNTLSQLFINAFSDKCPSLHIQIKQIDFHLIHGLFYSSSGTE